MLFTCSIEFKSTSTPLTAPLPSTSDKSSSSASSHSSYWSFVPIHEALSKEEAFLRKIVDDIAAKVPHPPFPLPLLSFSDQFFLLTPHNCFSTWNRSDYFCRSPISSSLSAPLPERRRRCSSPEASRSSSMSSRASWRSSQGFFPLFFSFLNIISSNILLFSNSFLWTWLL